MTDKERRDAAVDEFLVEVSQQLDRDINGPVLPGIHIDECRTDLVIDAIELMHMRCCEQDAIACAAKALRIFLSDVGKILTADNALEHETTDGFRSGMKARLDEKAEQGYSGWDSDYRTDDLVEQIFDDTVLVENERQDEKCVDIANRCMMVWYRAKVAA